MVSNLLKRFISVLNKIFRKLYYYFSLVGKVKTPSEVSHDQNTSEESFQSLPSGTPIASPTEKQQGASYLERQQVEEHPEHRIMEDETEWGEMKPSIETDITDVISTRSIRKPVKKKYLIEGKRKRISPPPVPKIEYDKKKEINLGARPKRLDRSLIASIPQEESDEGTGEKGEKENIIRLVSPFVELDLDTALIFLVLPQQRLPIQQFSFDVSNLPGKIDYQVELNGERKDYAVEVRCVDGVVVTSEERIPIEKPLKHLRIIFPEELQDRKYIYNHISDEFYIFSAVGGNCGRFYYLFDGKGDINPIPKRDVWILLDEEFELVTEPVVIEEKWLWERYQPFLINMRENDRLIVRKRDGEKESLNSGETFYLEGEQLVDDLFKEQSPLLIGRTLVIKASEPGGPWCVWIQNEFAGYKVVAENWSGSQPLFLSLSDALPCDYGEFQIDVCQLDSGVSLGTLFFRWIPFIELSYPKNLIIPDPFQGHNTSLVKVKLDSVEDWQLSSRDNLSIGIIDDYFCIEVPPELDIVSFSVLRRNDPYNKIKIMVNIPRLKWRTSKEKVWADRLLIIERKDLVRGQPFSLHIRTNDFYNKYDLFAVLESHGEILQEAKFLQKGVDYALELNEFYDTIFHNKKETTLEVMIWTKEPKVLIGKVKVISFPADMMNPDYYTDKKTRQDFSEEELLFLNQLFECCSNILRIPKILNWYKEKKIAIPDFLKPYIEEEKEVLSDDILRTRYPVISDSWTEKEFDEFFKSLEKIISLPSILYLWFYGHITIPMIPRTRDALLFYLNLFEKKENILYIFEKPSYIKENLDDELLELLLQAQVLLDIRGDFEKDFQNPEYRRQLFFQTISKPENMCYLKQKWDYFMEKYGSLGRLTRESDLELLGEDTIREAKEMKFIKFTRLQRSLAMNVEWRVRLMLQDKSEKDISIAISDALNFFKEFFVNEEGDNDAN
ncbi:MAG: hypothetical protein ACUVXA_11130 [Candidatus Jordarchaeum sp.]|uniref:hypothetical protein n=1 Tax=Candidatus Jordarchaeum sp. TaxID=2823881 RepID=UPI00404B502F